MIPAVMSTLEPTSQQFALKFNKTQNSTTKPHNLTQKPNWMEEFPQKQHEPAGVKVIGGQKDKLFKSKYTNKIKRA